MADAGFFWNEKKTKTVGMYFIGQKANRNPGPNKKTRPPPLILDF